MSDAVVTMKIGEVAERTGLSLRTIRHYDETGLVVPSARTSGGFRMYTDVEVARLLVIKRMKPLGYTLEEMGDLLDALDDLGGPWMPDSDRAYGSREPAGTDREDDLRRLDAYIADADERLVKLRERAAMAEEFARTLRYQAERHRQEIPDHRQA